MDAQMSAFAHPAVPMMNVLPSSPQRAPTPVRTLESGTILGGRQEIVIDHHGVLYRLRVTAQGKLILTK
jgi:hemin uptake protein HemP